MTSNLPPQKVNATTMNMILRAHCKAEMARAKYWVDEGSPNTKKFYMRLYAFWEEISLSKADVTDFMAIQECKRTWDQQEKLTFPETEDTDFLVMPNVGLKPDVAWDD